MKLSYIFFSTAIILNFHIIALKNLGGSSYTRLNNNTTSSNPKTSNFVGVFGDAYVNERNNQISLMFQYTLPEDRLVLSTVDTGTVTGSDPAMLISSGSGTGASASAQSKDLLKYSPGKDGSCFFTAGFTGGTTTSGTTYQYAGLYDSENGFAIGYQNATFGILYRNNSSDQFIEQSNFNIDKLDGTGPSGFIIDPSKINVYRISYGWLGATPIMYQVLKEDGQWITFHRLQIPNSSTNSSLSNPTLPIRMEVSKTSSDTTDLTIKTFSWDAAILGPISGERQFATTSLDQNVTTTPTPILSLKNKNTFHSQTNRITIQLIFASISAADSFNSETLIKVGFYLNATLTGASFTDINSTYSVAQKDTSATSFSGGTLLFSNTFSSQNADDIFFKTNSIKILLQPGDILTITISRGASGDSAAVATAIVWEEQI